MKNILFALCAFLLVGSAFAGVKEKTITTSSIANGAVDTVVVDISDIAWFDNSGAATIHFSIANLEVGAADSCEIGVDMGAQLINSAGGTGTGIGDGAWTTIYTGLVTTATDDIDPGEVVNLTSATFEGSDLRLRVTNRSGGAEAFTLRISYPTVQE